LERACMVC